MTFFDTDNSVVAQYTGLSIKKIMGAVKNSRRKTVVQVLVAVFYK